MMQLHASVHQTACNLLGCSIFKCILTLAIGTGKGVDMDTSNSADYKSGSENRHWLKGNRRKETE